MSEEEIKILEEQWGDTDNLVNDLICNYKELQIENEKLTNLWLDSQEKRRNAIKYLKQPYRDNFDYSKAELLEILGDKE